METPIKQNHHKVISCTFHETQHQFNACIHDDGAISISEIFFKPGCGPYAVSRHVFNKPTSPPSESHFKVVNLSFSCETSGGPKYLAGIADDRRVVVWDVRGDRESDIDGQQILSEDFGIITGITWGSLHGDSTLAISSVDPVEGLEVETMKFLKIDSQVEAGLTVAQFRYEPLRHSTPKRVKFMKFVPNRNILVSCNDNEMIVWELPKAMVDTSGQLVKAKPSPTPSNGEHEYVAIGLIADASAGETVIEITENSGAIQEVNKVRIADFGSHHSSANPRNLQLAPIVDTQSQWCTINTQRRWCTIGLAPAVFGETIRLAGADRDGNIEICSIPKISRHQRPNVLTMEQNQSMPVKDLVWSPFATSSHCCVAVPQEASGICLFAVVEQATGAELHCISFGGNLKAKSAHWTKGETCEEQGIWVECENGMMSPFRVAIHELGVYVEPYYPRTST